MASMWDWYREESGDEEEPTPKKPRVGTEDSRPKADRDAKSPEVDINLLSSSSGDMDSDLEVLEEVTNTRNGDTTGGESLMVRSGDQPAFGASIPHRASNKSKSVDPRIAEARRRNQEALERLRAAAAEQDESEVEELSEPDSPGECKPSEAEGKAGSEASDGDEEEVERDNKVLLKLVTKARQELQMKIKPNDPLCKLFSKYRELAIEKGWATEQSKLKFVFDGDQIQDADTAASLDLEDGVVIDVHVTG